MIISNSIFVCSSEHAIVYYFQSCVKLYSIPYNVTTWIRYDFCLFWVNILVFAFFHFFFVNVFLFNNIERIFILTFLLQSRLLSKYMEIFLQEIHILNYTQNPSLFNPHFRDINIWKVSSYVKIIFFFPAWEIFMERIEKYVINLYDLHQ